MYLSSSCSSYYNMNVSHYCQPVKILTVRLSVAGAIVDIMWRVLVRLSVAGAIVDIMWRVLVRLSVAGAIVDIMWRVLVITRTLHKQSSSHPILNHPHGT